MSTDARATDDVRSGRLDKWLWFARIVKSRTMAAGLVEDGKVRLNRSKVLKPSHGVRAGDVVTVSVGPKVRVLKVLALGDRRGPPSEARVLFEDLTPMDRTATTGDAMHAERAAGAGRPTKRERRQTERLKGG